MTADSTTEQFWNLVTPIEHEFDARLIAIDEASKDVRLDHAARLLLRGNRSRQLQCILSKTLGDVADQYQLSASGVNQALDERMAVLLEGHHVQQLVFGTLEEEFGR